jgi:hypothetical protein
MKSIGFHLLDALPKGRIFNIEHSRDNILTPPFLLLPQVDSDTDARGAPKVR